MALVGAKRDLVPSVADHAAINALLQAQFCNSIAWRFLLDNDNGEGPGGKQLFHYFPVDNTKGRSDPAVGLLMQCVESSMDRSEYTHMPVPLTWFRALDKVAALYAS